jgi:lipoprotein-releasing system permease protein
MEKRMMFIVVALIIAVAAFNIVSTMVMVVNDKRADIAILRTQGAQPTSILLLFLIQGMIIGLIGILLGGAGGVLISLNIDVIIPFIEGLFGVQFFPGDVYYISQVPSDLHWADVWEVCGLAFLLSFLATLYPARMAAKTLPAEALRYE